MNASYSKNFTVAYTFALKWDSDYKFYNIHGLWPEHSRRVQDPEFNNNELRENKPLMEKLMKYWNSNIHKEQATKAERIESDLKFWHHEWTKHGCESNYALVEYFMKCVQLYEKHTKPLPVSDLHHQLHFYLDEKLELLSTDLVTKQPL